MTPETIFRQHYDWALRAATNILGPEDAEDVVSSVFCSLVQAMNNGKGPREADTVKGYLRKAIKSAATRVYARRSQEIVGAADTTSRPSADHAALVCRAADRARALRSAPTVWTELIWRVDIQGQRAAEVADELGMTQSAAVSALARARAALRAADYPREPGLAA